MVNEPTNFTKGKHLRNWTGNELDIMINDFCIDNLFFKAFSIDQLRFSLNELLIFMQVLLQVTHGVQEKSLLVTRY